jgi:hypothetical protein
MTVNQQSSDDANDNRSWNLYKQRQQYKKRTPEKKASDKERSKQYYKDFSERRKSITLTDEEIASKREKQRVNSQRYRDSLKKARQQNIEEKERKAASRKRWRDKQKLLAKAGEDPASAQSDLNVSGDDAVAADGLDEAQNHTPPPPAPDYDDDADVDYYYLEPDATGEYVVADEDEGRYTVPEPQRYLEPEPTGDVAADVAADEDEGRYAVPEPLRERDSAEHTDPEGIPADDTDTEDNNTFAEWLQDLSRNLLNTFGIFRSKTTTTRSAVRSVCVLL